MDLKTLHFQVDKCRVSAGVEKLRAPTRTGMTPSEVEPLSRREHQVLRELVGGKSNAQIAQELYISRETVKKHVSSILGKTRTENRVQAAVQAVRRGLV